MHRASEDLSDPDRNLAESIGQPDIPEDIDLDLITEESNDNRIYTPPAHIAARFYRPTNNRRKSSAASSRRNSISSAHSHQSHTSSRYAGSQSSYIAQHMRRASILEDRKARLADRAAHAEKVRLRAALAKAAPRNTTNIEERALAAQQAREKNLAEIVASCAEEVKRAKGIAESMKERREAEGKKSRKEMEERLAEAERRREEIRNKGNNNNKRGRSMSHLRKTGSPVPQVKEVISESTAASRIQRQWRIHRRGKALAEFTALGLTIDGVRSTSVEEVIDLLNQEKVLKSTAAVLRICGLEQGEIGSVNEMTAIRIFLSAFLILGHPTHILSSSGEQSGEQEQVGVLLMARDDLANPGLQDVIAKARDLLISFENVLSQLNLSNSYTPPPSQLSTFPEAYSAFNNAFIAWKARDSSALIDTMVASFVELDSIWQTVKDSTEEVVTEAYKEGIRKNQLELMVRIKKLAGPEQGKRLITNAVRKARKARAAKQPAGDPKPRATESAPPLSLSASLEAVKAHIQTPTPPPTPKKSQNSPVDELRRSSPYLPDNRTIVHELAMNEKYEIQRDDYFGHRDGVNQVVFDSMRQEIAAGNSAPWVLAMTENVKRILQGLLRPGGSLHTMIGEALDSEVVARELQNGTFSYERFFSFMATLLPQLCAPNRDAELKKLIETELQSDDMVSRLQALIQFIDLMHMDYANYMLRGSAPALIKEAANYEAKLFSETMKETSNSLTATETTWRTARDKVMTEAAKRDPENVQLARARPTPEKIYAQMLVDIFTSIDGSVPIPETLQLDTKRIARIRSTVLRIVTTGSILLQSKNLLKRDVRSKWKKEADRIISVLEHTGSIEQAAKGVQAALETSRSMPVATKNHMRDVVSRILSASAAVAESTTPTDPRDPVMRLLLTRLRGHFMSRLTPNTAAEKSGTSESLTAAGLPEFQQHASLLVTEIERAGMLDKAAHSPWYELVIAKVEAENGSPSASGSTSTSTA